MFIEGPAQQPIQNEFDVLASRVPLAGARLLELGCGTAEKTRQIAERGGVAAIVAAEVDQIQHRKNLEVSDLPLVTFKSYGAQAIEEPDESIDIVLMFKSLHHVPAPLMDAALADIRRVLKPGGLAYISEPVYAGTFNEVIRLFNDEATVRRAAFAAVERAVQSGAFELVEQVFFKNVVKLQSFAQFEHGVLNVTHSDFAMTPQRLEQVRARFESYRGEQGYVFEIPNRVDLLRKRPGAA